MQLNLPEKLEASLDVWRRNQKAETGKETYAFARPVDIKSSPDILSAWGRFAVARSRVVADRPLISFLGAKMPDFEAEEMALNEIIHRMHAEHTEEIDRAVADGNLSRARFELERLKAFLNDVLD